MADSDSSDDCIMDALDDYKERLETLSKTFNDLRAECMEFPAYITEDKSTKIKTNSERFEKKCEKIKDFRKKFISDPKKYGVEIEKRLSDIEQINNNLKDVRDSIYKRREAAEPSTEELDASTVTTITLIIDV